MRKRNLLALLAVPTLGALALAGYLATRGDTIETDVFPEVLPIQVRLHPGEILRQVETYEDKITPKHAVADDQQGTTSEYWFRPDGTLERALTRSAPDLTGKTVEVRRADILPDGTYKYDVEFYLTGIKSKELVLLDPKTQHRKYFFEDGDVHKDQYIMLDNKGWRLNVESIYREDSSLARTYKALENEGFEQKDFSDAGVLIKAETLSTWKSDYTLVEFQADGKTPIREIKQDHTHTKLTTYRKDGSKAEVRNWSGDLANRAMMDVTIYDTAGKPVLYQSWFPKDGGGYYIWLVHDFWDNGNDRRMIYFNANGAVQSETEHWDDQESKWTLRYYREDGTLREEREMATGGNKGPERQYSEADNRRVAPFPKDWLAQRDFTVPEIVVPYVPPYSH